MTPVRQSWAHARRARCRSGAQPVGCSSTCYVEAMRPQGRLTPRRSRALAVLACLASLAGACANLSGLSGGSAPDASSTHDVALHDDAAERDATQRDASLHDAPTPNDATPPHDVTLRDSPASDAKLDGGSRDAGHMDSHADAGPSDAAGKGAPWDSSQFCKNFVIPDGASLACDDFDENSDPGSFGQLVVNNGGVLTTSSEAWASAPHSIHITGDPGSGSNALQAYIQPSPAVTGTRYSLQCDIFVRMVAPSGANQIGGFVFLSSGAPNAALTIGIVSNADGGIAGFVVGENTYGLDGGHFYEVHPTVGSDAGIEGWARVKLTVSTVDGGFVDDLTVDGVTREGRFPLSKEFFVSSTETGLIGWQFVTGEGQRDIYIDNVAFVNE